MDSISVESDPRKFSVITRIFAKILHRSLGKSASRLLGYSLPLLFDVIPGIFIIKKILNCYHILRQKEGICMHKNILLYRSFIKPVF